MREPCSAIMGRRIFRRSSGCRQARLAFRATSLRILLRVIASKSTMRPRSGLRLARASSGRRPSGRFASTTPMPSPRASMTKPRLSTSRAAAPLWRGAFFFRKRPRLGGKRRAGLVCRIFKDARERLALEKCARGLPTFFMAKTSFFPAAMSPTIRAIVDWTGAEANDGADLALVIRSVAPIDRAGPGDLTFLDNPRYVAELAKTRASAVLLQPRHTALAPAGCVALSTSQPYRAFTEVLLRLFPSAAKPASIFGETGISARAIVHPAARLEAGVIVDPGAIVGAGAHIGAHTLIGANAVIGPGVHIGRDRVAP